MKERLRQLEQSHYFWVGLAISFVFFLLRLPSLFEPYWYGDEGIYETLGLAIDRGRILYTQIWDNKPPLLYYTYALVGGNQYLVRLLSLGVGVGSIIIFFGLCQKLFHGEKKPTFIATTCFALLFGLPIIEGNIANAENFMLLPIIAAAYVIYHFALEKDRLWHVGLAGILLGIAFLYKIVGIFDFAAMGVFLLLVTLPSSINQKSITTYIKYYWRVFALLIGSFLLPFVISLVYFLSKGALNAYIQAIFLSNVGYVGYNNAFIVPQGLLISKFFLLGAFALFLLVKRNSFAKPTLFISLWLAFSLFNSFFSQRPYTHYVLVLLPSFSLLLGSIFSLKNKYKLICAIATLFVLITVLIFFGHWSIKKTVGYYTNYLGFVSGSTSVTAYESFFDRRVPYDMELVNFINSHKTPTQNIFVWGNNAQMYYLTGTLPPGRFTVAYHIAGTKKYEAETAAALARNQPAFMIEFHDAPAHPFTLTTTNQVLTTQEATIYERVN